MSPCSTRKWTSAIGTRQFTMAFSLPNIVIKPDHVALVYGYRPCVLPCPKTQEHWSTCVDSWVHRVPENGHQPLGRDNSLWRSACPILWSTWSCSASLWRLPPVYSLALELRNTKVPWGTRKWTSAIGKRQFTMAFSLPNIVIKPDLETLLYGYRPCVLPSLKTQEHQRTCVVSWLHRVPENGHQPLGRGNSLWRSACPILWSNPTL